LAQVEAALKQKWAGSCVEGITQDLRKASAWGCVSGA
jgi:hypothetical protein